MNFATNFAMSFAMNLVMNFAMNHVMDFEKSCFEICDAFEISYTSSCLYLSDEYRRSEQLV